MGEPLFQEDSEDLVISEDFPLDYLGINDLSTEDLIPPDLFSNVEVDDNQETWDFILPIDPFIPECESDPKGTYKDLPPDLNIQTLTTNSNTSDNNPTNSHFCEQLFTSTRNLAAHKDSVHNFEGNSSPGISSNEVQFLKKNISISNKQNKKVDGVPNDTENKRGLRNNTVKKKSTQKKGPFVCDVCSKKFEKRRNFDNHLLTHTNEKPFRCKECSRGFRQRAHLHVHLLTHLVDKPFKCKHCPNSYIRLNHLENHILRTHVVDKQYECAVCSRKCFDEGELKSHMNDMHNPATHNRYTCDVCNESYRHLNTIKKHLQIKHSRTDRCDRCRRSFSDREEFDRHLSKTSFSYGCNECPQSLPIQCLLFQHKRTHQISSGVDTKPMQMQETHPQNKHLSRSRTAGIPDSDANLLQNPGFHTESFPITKPDTEFMHCRESGDSSTEIIKYNMKSLQSVETVLKSYICEICFEAFSQEAHLKYHERTQHRNATWTCKRCGTSFSRKYRLKHHEMVHENPKPFSCDKCSRAYIHQHDLKKHLRIHEDEKPYKCDQCPSSFPTNTYLKRHLVSVHNFEKRFKCLNCSSSFSYASELRRHSRIHVDTKPYCCSFCSKNFKLNDLLRRHVQRCHSTSDIPTKVSPSDPNLGASQPEEEIL